jgi:hypothetical protein
MHGVNLDKELKKRKQMEELTFKSPEEYEKMDPEKRKELTKKMKMRLFQMGMGEIK